MRRPTSFVITAVVATALALPMPADAQATRRGGESSGDSGSSGGGATTRSSPGGGDSSGGSAAPRIAVPRVSSPSAPSSSQPSSRSGGVGDRPSGASPSGNPARVRSAGTSSTSGLSTGATRNRGARAISGYAQPRGTLGGPNDPSFIFLPYYPWYSSGVGGYLGYGYNPWGFGYTRWSRYGGWYDPFGYPYGYGVFGYDPYGFGYGHQYWGAPYYVSVGDQYDQDRERDRTFGSLRLRASPDTARVYVDGALAGTVDDFNGLSDHLELEQGIHQIEIRADGYEVYRTEVEVEAGQTRTARVSLKRLE